MKAKKLIAFLFLMVMTLVVCSVTSFAADCTHAEGGDWVTTQQTCSQTGSRKLVCRTCGEVIMQETIPTHNYQVVYTGKVATCTEEGFVTKLCSWCMTLINETTAKDPTNHDYADWVTDYDSTCTSTGLKHRSCKRCSDREEEVIAANVAKHVADENSQWEVVVPAGCDYVGTKRTTCTVCGEPFNSVIPSHSDASDGTLSPEEHAKKYIILTETPGTCTTPGSRNYTCNECTSTVSVPTGINPDNHKYAGWRIIEEATCTEAGVRERYCTGNYAHKQTETYYEQHEYTVEVSYTPGADCDSVGVKVMKCANCDATTTVETVAEHIWNPWVLSGNCLTGGNATRTCVCGDNKEETSFEKDTHLNYTVISEIKPSCLYEGSLYIRCTDCNTQTRIYPEEYTATGHTSGTWVTIEAATCSSSGIMERNCVNCGEQLEERVIQQLSHQYIILAEGTDATCTEAGVTPYFYCTQCGYMVKPETIRATGHSFVEQNHNGGSSVLICEYCYQYKVGEEGEGAITCDCLCHNSDGIAQTVYKVISFFNKLFGREQFCECGAQHYENTSIFEDIFGPILDLFR